MTRLLIATLFFVYLIVPVTFADVPAQGYVCWTPNTEPDLAGYKVYYGATASGDLSSIVDVGRVTDQLGCPTGQIGIVRDQAGQPDGAYYAGVLAYDQAGNPSGVSEVGFTLDATPPSVVGGVEVK